MTAEAKRRPMTDAERRIWHDFEDETAEALIRLRARLAELRGVDPSCVLPPTERVPA
jgi:hypothetical protein